MSSREIGPRIRPDGVPDAPTPAYDQFCLRLPDGLRARIKAAADANGRSMNSEIIARLQEEMDAREAADMTALGRRLLALAERLEAQDADTDA